MTDREDLLRRAYVTLTALKENLGGKGSIGEEYVSEYHSILNRMNTAGLNVEEFKIPSSQIASVLTRSNYITGEKTYSEKQYAEKSYFMFKLDSLLGYFSLSCDEHKPAVGFSVPS